MAIHVQMSEEAEAQLRSINLRNKLSSLLACLAFLGIGTLMLYVSVIYIETALPPAFDVYTANDDAPPSNKPKVKELSSKRAQATVTTPKIAVAENSAEIAMANIDIPLADVALESGLDTGLDIGGLGAGLGEQGGGMGSGDSSGSALEGTFYDFKQTRAGAAIGKNMCSYALTEFVQKNWSDSVVSKYFQAKTKLYASHFMAPINTKSELIVDSFSVKGVTPEGVGAIYRGKVRAPRTGRFRFVGAGDGTLAVRFNRKMVFEGGFYIPTLGTTDKTKGNGLKGATPEYHDAIGTFPGHEDYRLYQQPNLGWNKVLGGLTGGNVFEVEEGKVYPIEVLFADVGGNIFGFALLLEDVDNPVKKGEYQVFDLFRTNFGLPDENARKHFVFNEDSPIWTVVP